MTDYFIITKEEMLQLRTHRIANPLGEGHGIHWIPMEYYELDKVVADVLDHPLSEALNAERERVLIPLLNQCKIEELNNKKRCDAGVDNISAFQLRARQAAFERCAIWIEESLRG